MPGTRRVASGLLLLVADASRINQQVAQGMRERLGYRAVVASNGREALAALAAEAYAAVRRVLVRPELDGYATAAAIRRQEPAGQHLPILAMSASRTEDIRAPCLAAGVGTRIIGTDCTVAGGRCPMSQDGAALRRVNLTVARNLSPLFDEAVRQEQPVLIVRNRREWGVLVSRDAMLRMLESYRFHVHVVPEDDGSFTLWLDELEVGGHGPTLREARQELLTVIRSYLRDYRAQFDLYRHLPDRASQEPYVVRLSLARDDAELIGML